MTNKLNAFFITVLVFAFLLFTSTFVVKEGERAMVKRLGEFVTDSQGKATIYKPGFHFKLPLITDVIKLGVRLKNLDAETSRIPTDQQKYLLVDYYGKWRIVDLPLFYKRTGGNDINAVMLLKQKCNDTLRAAFGKRSLADVVSAERTQVMSIVQETANKSARKLGIEVLDIRIKGIELPRQVQESVFARMRTEREKTATKYRYEGRAQAERIVAEATKQAQVMLATAKKDGQLLRAKGDLDAANTYNKAYRSNANFYAFYQSLKSYQDVFKGNHSIFVLKKDDPYLRYFKGFKPKTP